MTGCEINYSLTVDDFFVEKIDINGYAAGDLNDEVMLRVDTGIPLNYDYSKSQHNNLYKTKLEQNSDILNLSLTGKFGNTYSNSNAVLNACREFSVKNDNNEIVLKASDFKIFDNYDDMESLTINIKSDYHVKSNNADIINKNVYTWKIDSENYDTKKISITFQKKNAIEKLISGSDIIVIIVTIMILLLIGFSIYRFLVNSYKKKNTI